MSLPFSPKKVVVLALPGARELDLASVLDVFTVANSQLAPNPAYQIEVVTSERCYDAPIPVLSKSKAARL
jgi:lipid A disaccharide synthetase